MLYGAKVQRGFDAMGAALVSRAEADSDGAIVLLSDTIDARFYRTKI